MSNDSSKKASSPYPASPSSIASASSSNLANSYIGSLISLTSKHEIRYEGILYYLNPQDSTIGLKNVKSYGTEGRRKDGPQIPPNDKVYEYILFRGSDIKDLQVKASPPFQEEEAIQNDPAIIQSQSLVGPSSSSKLVPVGVESLTQSSFYQEPPILTRAAYPDKLVPHHSGIPVGAGDSLQAPQDTNAASLHMPMYRPGYNGTSSGISYALQHPNSLETTPTASSLPAMMQIHVQPSAVLTPKTMGWTCPSDIAPVPSLVSSNSQNLDIAHTLQEHHSTSSILPSFLLAKSSLPSHPLILSSDGVTKSSIPVPSQDMGINRVPVVGKVDSDSITALSNLALPCSTSIPYSTLSPFLVQTPTLITPGQLAQPRPPPLVSFLQNTYPDQTDKLAHNSTPHNLSTSMNPPVAKAPLLPLPGSAEQFTEEFDFEAMNEKFKKDEVWGYLGGTNQRDKAMCYEDNAAGQDVRHYRSVPHLDPKPAYNKDEFFDALSCNSHVRGQNRFSERMKQDTETFGNFRPRAYPGYGGYGAGRGAKHHGSYQGRIY
ncbi:hypothetical protein NMG60_11027732 [Bertholletia excelsa]